jgi:iron complex outermembrane receptor protein
MMRSYRHVLLLGASALILGLPDLGVAPAAAQQAQTAQSPTLEEIVVTSRKREEKLLEVPLAITAFTEKDIEKAQLFDMRQIATLSPGLSFQNVGGNGAGGRFSPTFYFRGLFYSSPLPRQQTGAVFVDGMYVLGGVTSINTVDVERVEVIKGPQNVQFGRNTFGGAVNFITKNPGNEFKGSISGEASTRGSYDTTLSVEGPIVADKLAARLSATNHKKGAMYTATDGGKLGEEATKSVTGTLYFTPTDSLKIRLRGHYQQDDDGPATWGYLQGSVYGNNSCANYQISGKSLDGTTTQNFTVGLPYFCGHIPTLKQVGEQVISSNTTLASQFLARLGNPNGLVNAFVNNTLNDPLLAKAPKIDRVGMTRRIWRLTGQAEYELPMDIVFHLNLSWNRNDTNAIVDPDKTDLENEYTVNPALFQDWSAEARVESSQKQRFRWMLGGNFYRGWFDSNFNGDLIFQKPNSPLANGTVVQATGAVQNTPFNRDGERAKVYAAFGSVEYDLLENLTAIAELRYQKDVAKVAPSNPASQYATFKDWLPRGIVKYRPTPEWTVYASWSRGVLPGQFNSQYLTAAPAIQTVLQQVFPGIGPVLDSQKLDSYEIGSKQSAFDNRLQYTLAAYLMKWHNIAGSSAYTVNANPPTIPQAVVFTGLLLPGDATLKGVELESTFAITPKWDINLRAAYQTGTYDKLINPFISVLAGGLSRFDGKHLPRTPDWMGTIATSYRDNLSGDWDWFVRGEANYTGRMWDSEANIVRSDSYWRVNSRAGVERNGLLVELYVKNLLNDKHWDYAFRNASLSEPGPLPTILQANPPGSRTYTFYMGVIVQAPDKREFGIHARYEF